MIPCEYRWEASRPEVETLPVNHVCNQERLHVGVHRCSCGAERINTSFATGDVDLSQVEWKGRMVPFHLFVGDLSIDTEEAAIDRAQLILDQFPPMNDADLVAKRIDEGWVVTVTVWWA